MIVPQEHKYNKISFVITVAVMVIIAIIILNTVLSTPPYYAAPGSNTETWGAPDGTYLQKDWGSFDNQTRIWSFAICDHDYLGPLHGSWKVADGVWVPIWKVGVYPTDARLYVTVQDNIIVDVSVHSQMEYGN